MTGVVGGRALRGDNWVGMRFFMGSGATSFPLLSAIRMTAEIHDVKASPVNSLRRGCQAAGCQSKGFSLFELVVVICIVAVLASVFLGRVLFYQEQAEKAAMVEMVGIIQTALILQYGEVLTRGKASDLVFLQNDKPMNWLQQQPHNYAGEFFDPSPLSVEPGSWVFDLKTRDLIYVINIANNFKPGSDGKNWIRYHAVFKYESPRLPSLQAAPHELTSLLFEPVEPYSWF